SVYFPDKNCQPAQADCAAAFRGPQPDLDARRLQDLTAYVAGLEEPKRRGANDAKVKSGEALFSQLGCAACHKPAWKTAAGRAIHPYSDLLLHDMGAGLADGRPDFEAGPAEWRTAPLWGLGGAKEVNPQAGYLHDGRARSFTEAILWHGGEAQAARESFAALPAAKREALLAFLGSL
ncbi:MAG TPA: di-heme oxidoredictase family protein, partial [Magnetospirillaceae bacterium]|nr:di-heme oxidoredictase family protein [Magnetospirillaceae bacterium]